MENQKEEIEIEKETPQNIISVGDVQVASTKNSLKTIQKIVNEIIEKRNNHKPNSYIG